jgi:hypothetical protein
MTVRAPRLPTEQEMKEMIEEAHHNQYKNDYPEFIEWLAKNACIAVFDNYRQNYGGYSGKLMMVAWPTMTGHYEVYIWINDRICRVSYEWTVVDHDINVMISEYLLRVNSQKVKGNG